MLELLQTRRVCFHLKARCSSVLTQTLRSVWGSKSAMVGAWLKTSYPSS
jgi:hypothetical protein